MRVPRFALHRNIEITDRQSGSALLAALGVMLVLDLFAVSALAMSVSQTNMTAQERKGNTAFNIAEAGLNKAIWKFNNTSNYKPTSGSPDTGLIGGGEYEIVVADVTGEPTQNQIEVTSYVPNKTDPKVKKRKIVALVKIKPLTIGAGVFATGYIDNQGSAVVFIAPLDYRAPNARGGDMGSNGNISFQDSGLSFNDRSAGPSTFDALFGNPPVPLGNIITAGPNSKLFYKGSEIPPGVLPNSRLGTTGSIYAREHIHLNQPVILPTFNYETYKSLARANRDTRNTALWGADASGYYTAAEFTTKIMGSGNNVTYYGPVFVEGNVNITQNKNLTILDGMLVVKGNSAVALNQDKSSLIKVTHSTTEGTKLPGVMVFTSAGNTGGITSKGTFDIQGFVYAEKEVTIDVNATWTIRGMLMTGNMDGPSIHMKNSTLIGQYDPIVTSLTGVIDSGTVQISEVLSWREVAP